VIVLVAASIVLLSFIFSPKRGLLFREIRFRKNRNNIKMQKTLAFMYGIAKTHEDISHPHTIKILNNFQGFSKRSLQKLVDLNYVEIEGQQWFMTQEGYTTAANLYNQQVENTDG
jgi:manganese/zinc/iron transport system permease protein